MKRLDLAVLLTLLFLTGVAIGVLSVDLVRKCVSRHPDQIHVYFLATGCYVVLIDDPGVVRNVLMADVCQAN